MASLLRELSRISVGGTVDDRLHDEIERLTDEFIDLRGEKDPTAVSTGRRDILGMARR